MSWEEFLDLGRAHREEHPDALAEVLAGQQPDDLATLIYTSGTTGPPKGAMLSVANVEFAIRVLVLEGAFTDPPPGPDDLLLSYLPLSPRRRAHLQHVVQRRRPAPRSTSPSRSRRCPRTSARCSPPSSSASPGSGRSCWRASRSGSPGRPGSSARTPRSGSGPRTGSASSWCRTAARTRPARGCCTPSATCSSSGLSRTGWACARCGTPPPGPPRSHPRCCGSSWASGCRCTRSTG